MAPLKSRVVTFKLFRKEKYVGKIPITYVGKTSWKMGKEYIEKKFNQILFIFIFKKKEESKRWFLMKRIT